MKENRFTSGVVCSYVRTVLRCSGCVVRVCARSILVSFAVSAAHCFCCPGWVITLRCCYDDEWRRRRRSTIRTANCGDSMLLRYHMARRRELTVVVVVVVASRTGNLVCSGGTLVSSCRRRLVDGATIISVSEFATESL